VDGLSAAEVRDGVEHGGRFVVFQWVISVVVMSFRRNSPMFYIPPGQSTLAKSLPYCGRSLILGWWGFPWGLIWTPFSILRNLRGGIDVTSSVMSGLSQDAPDAAVSTNTKIETEAEAFLATVSATS
jgi:hypothetical protein